MKHDVWNVSQYERFRAERARPYRDLLARVADREVQCAADLGCGTAEPTLLLREHWPAARIFAVDSSRAMLQAAAQRAATARLELELADLATWTPQAPLDLIFSSAALHWLPAHEQLVPRLVSLLRPRGTLAVTVPANFWSPSHLIVAELAASERWAGSCGALPAVSVREPAWYAEQLIELGCSVDVWETTYVQALSGEDAVLEWLNGTTLRPIVERLGSESVAFIDELRSRLRVAYPRRGDHTLFPFRRLFFVATRS